MISLLPSDSLERAQSRCPCRLAQLRKLAIYYNEYLPPPPVAVVYGLEDTGKLKTISALFESIGSTYAVVKSRECLSLRHLLAKIFAACAKTFGVQEDIEQYDRIDSLNSLVVNLQKLLERQSHRITLVIDGLDRQKGGNYALLPTLARLGDVVAGLSILITSTSTHPLILHRSGIPYIHFPPYSRNEAIHLVSSNPFPLLPDELPDGSPDIPKLTYSTIYTSFVAVVYDTLVIHTASTSPKPLQKICNRLWPRFIWPLVSAEPAPSSRIQSHTPGSYWTVARLLSKNRSLFQLEGEKTLISSLSSSIAPQTFDQLFQRHHAERRVQPEEPPTPAPHRALLGIQPPSIPSTVPAPALLKFFSTLLLLSSYLASHTQPKHDIILFSRLSSSSSHKRRYLASTLNRTPKKPRKTSTKPKPTTTTNDDPTDATPTKPSRTLSASLATSTNPSKEKTHRSSRLLFEKTSNIPRPFTLERVVAILRAIHPDGVPRARGGGIADKVYGEIGELERLRLVVGVGEAGGEDGVVLEAKWRVNVGREVVEGLGGMWGLSLDGWEIE